MFTWILTRWVMWGLERTVRRRGWAGVFVHDYPKGAVPFSYSMGHWESAGAPEVIMFGMARGMAEHLHKRAFDDLKSGELTLRDGATWTLTEGDESWTGAWRRVHPSQINEHLPAAAVYRFRRTGDRRLEAFQLFAPDNGGKFPWEDGFDTDYTPRQPKLYRPA